MSSKKDGTLLLFKTIIYLGIESVSCRLWLRMAKMDVDWNWKCWITVFMPAKITNLQSNHVKPTPQEYINEFIIQKLNPLLVVDFRLISAFLHV